MLGGIGGQEEKGTTEDEMAGWHHQLNGHEFEPPFPFLRGEIQSANDYVRIFS